MVKTSELIWQDTQHQMLLSLIDQIRADNFDLNVLSQLHFQAEHHFCMEESYMAELGYPQREDHVRAHNQFRRELAQMMAMSDQMNDSLRQSLSIFLEEWLKRHMFGIDKQFEQFVLDSNRK